MIDTPTTSNDSIIVEFSRRIAEEWLPAYCLDPKRMYDIEGYRSSSNTISAIDARDFMRAVDNELVTDMGGGRFRFPQSRATEVIFWEGAKAVTPRPITLWLEPVITIATIARLHLDNGWPLDCLGTQSGNWEFDIIAFRPSDSRNEYIAGEVKKTSKELDQLLSEMERSCADGTLGCNLSPKRINAHNKWLGLCRCHAPIFWAVGPNGDSRVFRVEYSPSGASAMTRTAENSLFFRHLSCG